MNPDAASLDLLHGLVLPPPAAFWPPAPGWIIAGGILAALLLLTLARCLRSWLHNRYRRQAIALWRKERRRLTNPEERTAALAALAEILKRAALSTYPRSEVASLTDHDWVVFLNRSGKMKGSIITTSTVQLLEEAAYNPGGISPADESRSMEAARQVHQWLVQHHSGERSSGGAT